MDLRLALKVHNLDNVATIFADDVVAGEDIEVRDKKGNSDIVKVLGDIPYGHKVAVQDIDINEKIIKYGETIGVATQKIKKGDYVHVHNLDSTRGRGDLKGESAL